MRPLLLKIVAQFITSGACFNKCKFASVKLLFKRMKFKTLFGTIKL